MGKYLYCLIKEKAPKKFGQVYTINHQDLAMIVSETEIEEYAFTREHLLGHQKVIEKLVQKGYDVLPFRFGTVAKSAREIREKILKAKRKELVAAFETIRGKIELGLKALWSHLPSIFQEIVRENKEIQRAKIQAQKNPNRLKAAHLGELVQKALEQKREEEAERILADLNKLAVDSKKVDLISDSMILNAAFLVPKVKEKKFDQVVNELADKYDKRIKFNYFGPVPPYNFVKLCF